MLFMLFVCCNCSLFTFIITHPTFNLCRFHPSCMGMTIEQAKKIDHYMCSDCAKENGAKRTSNSYPGPTNSDSKVIAFFLCLYQLSHDCIDCLLLFCFSCSFSFYLRWFLGWPCKICFCMQCVSRTGCCLFSKISWWSVLSAELLTT